MEDDTMNNMEEGGNGVPTVYFYHPTTGEYVFSKEAERDPISGSPLLPHNATLSPPPHTDTYQAAVYGAGSWTIVPNYRGEQQVAVATKQLSTVDHIGPLEDGYQLVTEEEALSMSEHPYYWKEEDGELVAVSADEQAAIDREMMMADKRRQRDALFAAVDWRAQRYDDQSILNITTTDQRDKIARYRQYLRNFTNTPAWWTLTIQTYDDFEEE